MLSKKNLEKLEELKLINEELLYRKDYFIGMRKFNRKFLKFILKFISFLLIWFISIFIILVCIGDFDRGIVIFFDIMRTFKIIVVMLVVLFFLICLSIFFGNKNIDNKRMAINKEKDRINNEVLKRWKKKKN